MFQVAGPRASLRIPRASHPIAPSGPAEPHSATSVCVTDDFPVPLLQCQTADLLAATNAQLPCISVAMGITRRALPEQVVVYADQMLKPQRRRICSGTSCIRETAPATVRICGPAASTQNPIVAQAQRVKSLCELGHRNTVMYWPLRE